MVLESIVSISKMQKRDVWNQDLSLPLKLVIIQHSLATIKDESAYLCYSQITFLLLVQKAVVKGSDDKSLSRSGSSKSSAFPRSILAPSPKDLEWVWHDLLIVNP